MNTKLNKNKTVAILMMVLLLAVGLFAACTNPNDAATKAVNALYTDEEKLLAEDVTKEKVDSAKTAVEKVTEEDLKKELTEKTEMAEKMFALKEKADAMYTEEDGKVLANEKMEKKDWEEIKKQSDALKKDKKEDFVKAINTELADAKNYFDSTSKINGLYSDGAKRTKLKDDAKKATYDEAIKLADKIKNEDIKKQAKDGSDKIKKAVEAKEADRKKKAEAKKAEEEVAIAAGSGYRDDSGNYVAYSAEEIASNSGGGGYYEEDYSSGGGYGGGGYYGEDYSYGGGYDSGSSGGANEWDYSYEASDGQFTDNSSTMDEWDGSGNVPGVEGFDPGALPW